MPTLKYWDGSAWQTILGQATSPAYRQTVYSVKDDSTIVVGATAYGAYYGPTVTANIGPSGIALVHFYAQIGLSSGSDLIVTFQADPLDGGPTLVVNDANCLYVAPDGPVGGTNPWEQGPGHISGIMLAGGMTQGRYNFTIHYRVSQSTTSVLRRRLAVIPNQLVAQ
jgi:hypothetical protein